MLFCCNELRKMENDDGGESNKEIFEYIIKQKNYIIHELKEQFNVPNNKIDVISINKHEDITKNS